MSALTDGAGPAPVAYGYDPWGAGSTSFADSNRARFKGALWVGDVAPEVYYMRNRWYDAKAGRFLSEDPAGLSAGINLYAFAGNDPINGSDATGLQDTVDLDPVIVVGDPCWISPFSCATELMGWLGLWDAPSGGWWPGKNRPPSGGGGSSAGSSPSNVGLQENNGCPVSTNPSNHLSTGVAVSVSTINPLTSGGGGVWGANRQTELGEAANHYRYSGSGAGLNVSASLQSVWAWGRGPWKGTFKSINVSASVFGGSVFWTPGHGGWIGFSFGFAIGLPGLGGGISSEVTNYSCAR